MAMVNSLMSKSPKVLQRFPKLKTLSAPTSVIFSVLEHVPDTASLRRVHLWSSEQINLPSGVTHLCLWLSYADPSELPDWVDSMPGLRHLGLEVVLHRHNHHGVNALSIAQALQALLSDDKCRRLERLAIRIGDLIAQEASVQALLDFIQKNVPDPRIYIWWDRRCVRDAVDGISAKTEDAFAGRDIWSESRPWRELLPSVAADHLSEQREIAETDMYSSMALMFS